MAGRLSALWLGLMWLAAGAIVGSLSGILLDTALWAVSRGFFYETIELGSNPHPYIAVLKEAALKGGALGIACQGWFLLVHRLVPATARDWCRAILRNLYRVLLMVAVSGCVGALIYLLYFYDEQNYLPGDASGWIRLYRQSFVYFAIMGVYGGVAVHALLVVISARRAGVGRTGKLTKHASDAVDVSLGTMPE